MENKKTVRTIVRKIIKEQISGEQHVDVTIKKKDRDSRSSMKKDSYDVNYQITIDGKLMEIEGILKPYSTGRAVEYGFEPFYIDFQQENQVIT